MALPAHHRCANPRFPNQPHRGGGKPRRLRRGGCHDSSVLIDYLDGAPEAVAYVEERPTERALAPPLVLFEIYRGEIFKSGPAEFAAVDGALEWVTVVDGTGTLARAAARLQDDLAEHGTPLQPRDAFIAGFAVALNETLAVADSDFDVDELTERLDVEFV